MKQRPKGILALCTALLLVLLGGCQGRGVPPLPRTASSPSRRGAPQRWSAAPGPTAARRQGETVSLAQPPLVEGEAFWLPLEAVVAALGAPARWKGTPPPSAGWTRRWSTPSAPPGPSETGQIGRRRTSRPSRTPPRPCPPRRWSPQVREGVWYLPPALAQPLLYGGTLWTQPTQDPAAGLVILGRELEADLTLGGFSLASRPQWEDLPADLTRGMAETGQPSATGEPYDGVCWTGDGGGLLGAPTPTRRAGLAGGRHPLRGGAYHRRPGHPRGLKVGDTLDRAQLLYGPWWTWAMGSTSGQSRLVRPSICAFRSRTRPSPRSAYTTTSGGWRGKSPPSANRALPAAGPCAVPWVAKGYDPTPYKPALPAQAERVWTATVPRADPEPPARPRWPGRSGGRRRGEAHQDGVGILLPR